MAAGLVLALAINKTVSGVDLHTVGWILAAVGALILVLTAAALNRPRRAKSVATTTYPDGSHAATERVDSQV